jgi:hypothetical protein
LDCPTVAPFADVDEPVPMLLLLTFAAPPAPPFPPFPVRALMPPFADGAVAEKEPALPLPASVAVGSECEVDVPLAPLAEELEVDDDVLPPVAPPVPPPVVLPLLPLLLPVVPPLLPLDGFDVELLELAPPVLEVDGEAVEVEVEVPVVCDEPAPVAAEVELPEAPPPFALAELVFEPDAPLPATFAKPVRSSEVLHCSSSFETVVVLLPVLLPLALLDAVVLPWVAVGLPLFVTLSPLLVVVVVDVLVLPEPLLYEPLVLVLLLLPLFPFESAAATPAKLSVRTVAPSAATNLRCLLKFPP